MAKLDSTPITEDDLLNYITTRDDFNLELAVYHRAAQLGFNISHGGTYIDPYTDKARQYDIRASLRYSPYTIYFSIECKSLKPSFPLLVSRIPRASSESSHDIIVSYLQEKSPFSYSLLGHNSRTVTLRDQASIYKQGELVAKSTTQVGKTNSNELITGDSEVYDKWTQAICSADDLVREAGNYATKHNIECMFSFIMPILVISDDTLWAVDYNEDGSIKNNPHKVTEVQLFLDRASQLKLGPHFNYSHLHIYTKSRFLDILAEWATSKEILNQVFPQDKLRESLRSRD